MQFGNIIFNMITNAHLCFESSENHCPKSAALSSFSLARNFANVFRTAFIVGLCQKSEFASVSRIFGGAFFCKSSFESSVGAGTDILTNHNCAGFWGDVVILALGGLKLEKGERRRKQL